MALFRSVGFGRWSGNLDPVFDRIGRRVIPPLPGELREGLHIRLLRRLAATLGSCVACNGGGETSKGNKAQGRT
jgi:hypothetical protein